MDTVFYIGELIVKFIASDFFRSIVIVAGVYVAITSIKTARELARKKQSADVVFAIRNDDTMLGGLNCIAEHFSSNNSNIRSFATEEKKSSDEAVAIRYVLNMYEALSVGIQEDIYDESIIKRSFCGTLVLTYKRTTHYIDAVRDRVKRDSVYQEFEWLAKRWDKEPLKKPKES